MLLGAAASEDVMFINWSINIWHDSKTRNYSRRHSEKQPAAKVNVRIVTNRTDFSLVSALSDLLISLRDVAPTDHFPPEAKRG